LIPVERRAKVRWVAIEMIDEIVIHDRVDVTDQVCPMSFVKAKLALEDLEIGQRLEVRLRRGEPLANATRSFVDEGHRLLSRQPEDASQEIWRVVIEKGV
jgi:TusA-related sulfurtransferase